MDNGSAPQPNSTNKQVRFETDSSPPSSSNITSPQVKVALESVRVFLSTLHASLVPVVKDIGDQHVAFFKTLNKLKEKWRNCPSSCKRFTGFLNPCYKKYRRYCRVHQHLRGKRCNRQNFLKEYEEPDLQSSLSRDPRPPWKVSPTLYFGRLSTRRGRVHFNHRWNEGRFPFKSLHSLEIQQQFFWQYWHWIWGIMWKI